MRRLHIDIETYSSVDLTKSGVYAYTAAPDFTILLLAYAWDDGPVQLVDLTEEGLPDDIRQALLSNTVQKHSHNANFERTCLARWLSAPMPPEQWECSMVRAAMHGLPLSLEQAAQVLELEGQKDSAGKALIRYFTMPCKPSKANGGRSRNLPHHDRAKWEMFKRYCEQDVEVERQIHNALFLEYPETEQRLWVLDQEMNDRGVLVDQQIMWNAIACDLAHKERLSGELRQLTGLENPGSVAQLKVWLADQGVHVESLSKEAAVSLEAESDNPTVSKVLQLRLESAKTSVKKYQAMERTVCPDGRIRGLLQFHGAGRTGRWGGRGVQVHNLPRNYLDSLGDARQMLKDGDFEALELFYRSVPDTLSQLIRTTFIPSPERRFIISDFSAIEARVIAWLAGEQWRMDVFNGSGKIYEASAAQMFSVPVESVTKGSSLRQKGKIAELALGYQGAAGALIQMGALDMGLTEDELPELVSQWRQANPNIVQLWYDIGNAAIKTVASGREKGVCGLIRFSMHSHNLLVRLPSGRFLCYPHADLHEESGAKKLSYMGMNQNTHKWQRIPTYGGKLTENIVQAIARDCLAEAMLRVADSGMEIAFHVHDEIIIDAPLEQWSADEVAELMGQPIPWAGGLPLRAEAFESDYYMKD